VRSVSAILTVLRKEFFENLRERRTIISALFMGPVFWPLLFSTMLAIGVERGATEAERPIELAVAHGERAPNLLQQLRKYGIDVVPVDLDEGGARTAVQRLHRLVLLIPADYAPQFASGAPAPLQLYSDASDTASARNAARVRALLAQYNLAIGQLRLMARGVDPLTLSAVAVQDIDVSTPAERAVLLLGTLSYLILLTMLMGGVYLAIDATAGERERGSLEPLLTVPVRREHLIYGKLLASCAFMLLSLALTVPAFAIVLRFVSLERLGMSASIGPLTVLAIIAVCAPLAPLGAALMTVAAAFTRTYREAQTYVPLLLALTTLPLVFATTMGLRATTPMMAVPALSQHFLITSLLRAESLAPQNVALSAGVSLLLGAAVALFAGRLYHREALLG